MKKEPLPLLNFGDTLRTEGLYESVNTKSPTEPIGAINHVVRIPTVVTHQRDDAVREMRRSDPSLFAA